MADKEVFYGEVIWFNPTRGFGFLSWSDNAGVKQKDMFVHFSDVNCDGFKTLHPTNKVSFELGTNKNGDAKAVNVTVLRH